MRNNQDGVPEKRFYQDKLHAAWDHAKACVAYTTLGDFSWEEFGDLPITPKQHLKEAPHDFMAAAVGHSAKYYETTGTTGRPTPTPRAAEDVIWNTVSVAESWRDLLDEDERVLIMMPSDIVPVGDLIAGVCEYLDLPHVRCYPFATGISDWDRIVSLWETLRPTTVFIAPGVALQFSRLLKQRGQLDRYHETVTKIMLLGEVSTPPFRARLGRWWDAKVFDASYGSTETGTLAVSCHDDRLHLLTAANYFELATDGETTPLSNSGAGRLVVTPLNMYSRALLRLDTGDEVTVTSGCDCGNRAPVVQVAGRSSDALRVHGATLTVRGVEEIVFGATEATGYLMEADRTGEFARLILERDVRWDRSDEGDMTTRVQRVSRDTLGLQWDEVVFVNQLPATTKSGASQKNWKRSNFRTLETAR
ncbi:phenylacetate--CoA ligase family protein [Actinopolyspora sp. BKK1]|nr:phenylacetate--CoA ligase family protein [Actinopolyspora sp. BKK2]NHE78505.1 phenylacetate--CoA ligase family protein [Actinopolyspora sp. BKK1]